MKNILFISVVLLGFAEFSYSQLDKKNLFKYNIYAMAGFRPAYQIGYERKITENFSINNEVGYMTYYTPFAFRMSNSLSGIRWISDLRLYLNSKNDKGRKNYLAFETEFRRFGIWSELNVQQQNGAFSERKMVKSSFLTLGNHLKYGTMIPLDNSGIFIEVNIFAGVRYTDRKYKINEGESISQVDDGFFFIKYPVIIPNLGAGVLIGFGK